AQRLIRRFSGFSSPGWYIEGLYQPNLPLGFAQPLEAAAGDEHVFFQADVSAARYLRAQLQGEDVAHLHGPIGRIAVAVPPGAEEGRTVVRHPAEVVAQGVLVFGVTRLHQESASSSVHLPA